MKFPLWIELTCGCKNNYEFIIYRTHGQDTNLVVDIYNLYDEKIGQNINHKLIM